MIRVVIERGWSCMAEFKDILGHEGIIAHLQNAVSMDKISHSYITVSYTHLTLPTT